MTTSEIFDSQATALAQESRPQLVRCLTWPLLLALYGTLLWRSAYSLKALPLYILDWLVPVAGLGAWIIGHWRHREGWPRTALDLPLVAWLAMVSISTAFSTNRRLSLGEAWQAFTWMLILWLLVDAIRHG